jgi:uncharacterized coiled-coil protein SlyX
MCQTVSNCVKLFSPNHLIIEASCIIMSNPSTSTAASVSGRPAAVAFNAMPTPLSLPSSSRNFSQGRGRGHQPSRTPYVPRRRPQEPKLSTTYVGGQAQPNSEAELAAYGKAMAEFVKEMASYNEAIEGQSRSRNRGQKCSHHGSGNGNYDSNPDDPDASAQHMERARSSPSSQLLSSTTANPNGQANQNSVLQTTNQTLAHQATQLAHQAPQIRELNNKFLLAYNSLIPNSPGCISR